MSIELFHLPDVGEGLTEAEIVSWHVSVGDAVEVNQVVVDIETAKSVVELPSPYAGIVAELMVAAGQIVDVGTPIIGIETSASSGPGPVPHAGETASANEPKLLVGYGAPEPETGRRRRSARAGATPDVVAPAATGKARAKPPVRKLARVLGVDLSDVAATGVAGVVVRADVLAAAGRAAEDTPMVAASVDSYAATVVDEVVRYPIKGVRKHTAAAVVSSAFTAPHVTEFVTVDVTETLKLRDRVQARREFRDVRLTPLAFVACAYLRAIARTPVANGRWDEHAQEIVVPAAVNLGIAAATPRGLVVPNIRAAHRLGLLGLATGINELAATARAGRTQPEAMSGGTTTITNIGVFGIDTGTPILNPGETAILAVGAIRKLPWVVDKDGEDRIEVRSVLQLALSFDHRVMDGQEGSELLADTAAVLADPGLGLL